MLLLAAFRWRNRGVALSGAECEEWLAIRDCRAAKLGCSPNSEILLVVQFSLVSD